MSLPETAVTVTQSQGCHVGSGMNTPNRMNLVKKSALN